MDRLSILLTLMTGAVLTGGFAIAAFALGYYSWTVIIFAAILGFLASWPVAYLISRRIKRKDPTWSEERRKTTDPVPKPGAPEV